MKEQKHQSDTRPKWPDYSPQKQIAMFENEQPKNQLTLFNNQENEKR